MAISEKTALNQEIDIVSYTDAIGLENEASL